MKKIDKDYVLNRVGKALDYQFESYSWDNMLDDCDLTDEEREYARNNISYKAYRVDK